MGLKQYVGTYLYKRKKYNDSTYYILKKMLAVDLLCAERLDIISKLLVIDSWQNNSQSELPLQIYKSTIDIFTDGNFYEPGNSNKKDFSDFVSSFKKLFMSLKKDGFNKKISVIPIGINDVIIDGAHRLACASFLNYEVEVVSIPESTTPVYDYSYFQEKQMPINYLNILLCNYVKMTNKNVYVMCLWPVANIKESIKDVEILLNKFTNIICKKEVLFTPSGFKNFLINIYFHQDWIGSVTDGFYGIYGKYVECYNNSSTVIYIFEGPDLNQVIKLKEQIRDIFGIGKHSVHITDTNEESLDIIKIILNFEALKMINYGDFNKVLTDLKNKEFEKDVYIPPWYLCTVFGEKDFIVSDTYKDFLKDIDFKYDIEMSAYLFGYRFLTPKSAKLCDLNNQTIYNKISEIGAISFKVMFIEHYKRYLYVLKRLIKNILRKLGVFDYVFRLIHK